MADPDLELVGEGVVLLALPAFLPSVISSFFTQNKFGGALGPSPRSSTGSMLYAVCFQNVNCGPLPVVND